MSTPASLSVDSFPVLTPLLASLTDLPVTYLLAPIGAVTALVFAKKFYAEFMAADEGDADMVRVAGAVRDGANAYLSRQAKVVGVCIVLLVAALLVLSFGLGLQAKLTPFGVAIAAVLSGTCGFLGMRTATNASSRTAEAAKKSLDDGLKVAFRAGAVMGLCVTGFALADISFWLLVLATVWDTSTSALPLLTTVMLSFAMGASLQALFARVGGGIYTKAADVGADLVGKVEAGIPEDDARNPAAIADNVGDNVGDVAGMGADLYESYYGSILAAMALAASAAVGLALESHEAMRLIVAAPALAGIGILCSVFAIKQVRAPEGADFKQLLLSLHRGVWLASAIFAAVALLLLLWLLAGIPGLSAVGIWGAIVTGLASGLIIAYGTERYTSYEHKPTRKIADQSETGPATVIIAGVAEGMKSTWIPLVTTVIAIILAYALAGGSQSFLLGVFGVGIAAVGMLSTLAITLATDAYGPIADNAGGNAEMTHQPEHVRETTDLLDSLGNTTAATGKGFAIGSAALTALALLAAYVTTVQTAVATLVDEAPANTTAGADTLVYRGNGLLTRGTADDAETFVLLPTEPARAVFDDHYRYDASTPMVAAAATTADDAGRVRGTLRYRRVAVDAVPDATQEALLEAADGTIADGSVATPAVTPIAAPNLAVATVDFHAIPLSRLTIRELMAFYDVNLMNPRVLGGLFMGVMLVFVFCAMTMDAVGRAANAMMKECRRQFGLMRDGLRAQGRTDDEIADPMNWPNTVELDGKTYPDYANCVSISTTGALKEMIKPSVLAVVVPLLVGLVLGVPAVMGLLAGTLVCGFAVAIFMANAGGAWDNAKKYIESGKIGGKGSEAHKATVVGDTVGDPFKDTSGPSLNILIKLVSVVSVVFSALIVKYAPVVMGALGLA